MDAKGRFSQQYSVQMSSFVKIKIGNLAMKTLATCCRIHSSIWLNDAYSPKRTKNDK